MAPIHRIGAVVFSEHAACFPLPPVARRSAVWGISVESIANLTRGSASVFSKPVRCSVAATDGRNYRLHRTPKRDTPTDVPVGDFGPRPRRIEGFETY
jgi:hypothetical protein